jgi:hypothetical protein
MILIYLLHVIKNNPVYVNSQVYVLHCASNNNFVIVKMSKTFLLLVYSRKINIFNP